MISLSAAVSLIIYLVVAGMIFWLLWWLVNYIGPPEPFRKIANVILAVLAVLVVIGLPFVATAQQAPCKPTVVGRLDIVPVTSRIFHNTRNLRVWLPPGYDPSQKYPVLYILDGASAFDVCASYNHEEMHADETLTQLITNGKPQGAAKAA